MVGETWDNWRDTVRRTIELSPDSVTIYQMELPFNTVYSHDMLGASSNRPSPIGRTKRAWVDYAFDELCAAGYSVSSAYTLVKDKHKVNFSYRDNLWRGSDLLATGVASFGHVSGVHYQNQPEWPRVCRRTGARRIAAVARHAAHAASAAGARNDPAIENRPLGCRLLPSQVRRGDSRRMARRLAAISGR